MKKHYPKDEAAFKGWIGYGAVNTVTGEATQFEFERHFNTLEEAQAEADSLPKFLKARAYKVSYCLPEERHLDFFNVSVKGYLSADGVNKGVNETALKRLRKLTSLREFTWFEVYGNPLTRSVHLVGGAQIALHPDDEHLYTPDSADLGSHLIGMDCARKLGLEWTRPEPPSK